MLSLWVHRAAHSGCNNSLSSWNDPRGSEIGHPCMCCGDLGCLTRLAANVGQDPIEGSLDLKDQPIFYAGIFTWASCTYISLAFNKNETLFIIPAPESNGINIVWHVKKWCQKTFEIYLENCNKKTMLSENLQTGMVPTGQAAYIQFDDNAVKLCILGAPHLEGAHRDRDDRVWK